MNDLFVNSIREHQDTFRKLLDNEIDNIRKGGELIWRALSGGKKVLLCGNGGSAADAQHIAAEFVGRYESERRAYPSIALTTDTSALTAIGNDYGYERIFERQVQALAASGDVLIGLSTSGKSPNVLAAFDAAKEAGCETVGLTGGAGGSFSAVCDVCITVPSSRTSRIQEAHITIGHLWCEFVDAMIPQVTDGRN